MKHGLYGSTLYTCWASMKQRCYNVKCEAYPNYGGRGITVCDLWFDDPKTFIDWAEANGYSPGLTIERIDVNKGYAPDNCTWVDRRIQAINRRVLGAVHYYGVHLRNQKGRKPKYIASITVMGKKTQIGRFESDIDAAIARDDYILKNNLHEYPLNFPIIE